MRAGQVAIAVPIVVGLGALAGVLLLLPGRREVESVSHRAAPVLAPRSSLSSPMPAVARVPAVTTPSLADAIRHADAATLAAVTDQHPGATTLQVARDLVAYGRKADALSYLARRDDGVAPDTWRLRLDLLNGLGRKAEAEALLAAAVRTRGTAAAADIVWAAYAIDRHDLLVAGMTGGAVPPPDRSLALDLVRRAEAAGRLDLVAAVDRVGSSDWRSADPWLALRIARRQGDARAELAALERLPAAERDGAREAMLTRTGDRDGLRRLLLAHGDAPVSAERLLAAGFRGDAVAMLGRLSAALPADAPVARRLLYLLGPRPEAGDRAWLRARAFRLDRPDPAGWLRAYAERDAAAAALVAVTRHPLGGQEDALLLRLKLARDASDGAAGNLALAALLDNGALAPAALQRAGALLPKDVDPRLATTLARRRIDAGVGGRRDRLDIGWAALNRGDPAAARSAADAQLAATPDDDAALRLMARDDLDSEGEPRRTSRARRKPGLQPLDPLDEGERP